MARKRILIVSQHPLFDDGLSAILQRNPSVEVAGVCSDTAQLERQVQDLRADVLLVIGRPDEILIDAIRLLDHVAPCLITVQTTDDTLRMYHRILVRDGDLEEIVNAIDVSC